MTLAGLAWLADEGLEHGMLYVESDNDPANATYAAIGFSRHHTDRAYELGAHDLTRCHRPVPPRAPVLRYDPNRDELAALLDGEPRYRLDQVWAGIHERGEEIDDLTNLPKALRARLTDELPLALTPEVESISDDGDTVKWLWRLHDGHKIETVLMHYDDRTTVCVSSQAGCAMACGFCATGQSGFDRHLSVGEIVEQIVRARRQSAPRRVSNIVFMGMGEPFANYDRTWAAVERINKDLGIGARHITISTVGVVPGIERLAEEDLPSTWPCRFTSPTTEIETSSSP